MLKELVSKVPLHGLKIKICNLCFRQETLILCRWDKILHKKGQDITSLAELRTYSKGPAKV